MDEDINPGAAMKGFIAGKKLWDRYTLNRVLGRGGYGVVWLARDEVLEQDVAIKFLEESLVSDPDAIAALKREVRRSLNLTHPNIVRIYDFIQRDNLAAISMEYVDGDPLSTLKADQPWGCFQLEQIASWVQDLCQALEYSHARAHLVHRDLKPSNLIINRIGQLKVTDFGIASSRAESMSRIEKAFSGDVVFTSPQQLIGERPSVTDDIYSLGATIYDLLTGEPPFFSGNLYQQIIHAIPPPMGERCRQSGNLKDAIPAAWEETVASCLEKDPSRRPQSAAEVAARLFLSEPYVPMPHPGAAPAPGSAVRGTSSEPDPVPRIFDEDVKFTVYRPQVVAPAKWSSWVFFAHRGPTSLDEGDPLVEVERQARAILGNEFEHSVDATQESAAALPRESTITVVPFVPGLEFNPAQRSFVWQEQVHREEFRARSAAGQGQGILRGNITVYLGALVVAVINVKVEVADSAGQVAPTVPDRAQVYRKIFVSYSRRDRAVVEHFERLIVAIGDRYLRDINDIRAGEIWSQRLEELIKEADVFQLFWSSNSMRSSHVRQEWEFALSLGRSQFVRPTYWEEPIPKDDAAGLPPTQLQTLHFQRLPDLSTSYGTPIPPVGSAGTKLDSLREEASKPRLQVPCAAPREFSGAAPAPPAAARLSITKIASALAFLVVVLASIAGGIDFYLRRPLPPIASISQSTPPAAVSSPALVPANQTTSATFVGDSFEQGEYVGVSGREGLYQVSGPITGEDHRTNWVATGNNFSAKWVTGPAEGNPDLLNVPVHALFPDGWSFGTDNTGQIIAARQLGDELIIAVLQQTKDQEDSAVYTLDDAPQWIFRKNKLGDSIK